MSETVRAEWVSRHREETLEVVKAEVTETVRDSHRREETSEVHRAEVTETAKASRHR